MKPEPCPCNSQMSYQQCCQPYHLGEPVPTALALMKSRYSAFAKHQWEYLAKTDAAHGQSPSDYAEMADCQWLALNIKEFGEFTVSFEAWFVQQGQLQCISEQSQFANNGEGWQYTSGQSLPYSLPKRNDACICQSGKKFKKCCLK